MKIKFKKLHPDAKIPSYAHPGDAGMDFYALERTSVKPNERVAVKTGVSMEIPDGYVGLFWDKSSIGIREGVKTVGGVIDAGFRGEILIGVVNISDKEYIFEAGHKVAQLLIQKIERPEVEEVVDLNESSRGKGMYGSTGK